MVVDANLLLYAVNEDAPWNVKARSWLEAALSSDQLLGLTWPVLLATLRLSTRAAVFPQPLSSQEAFDFIDTLLDHPNSLILHPGPRHWGILKGLLSTTGVAGNLSSDAHLAAIAIEHGATLVSADRDFARFAGLRWLNPLR